jgi:hypothetical protein
MDRSGGSVRAGREKGREGASRKVRGEERSELGNLLSEIQSFHSSSNADAINGEYRQYNLALRCSVRATRSSQSITIDNDQVTSETETLREALFFVCIGTMPLARCSADLTFLRMRAREIPLHLVTVVAL